MNDRGSHWKEVNIGSGSGLVPSGCWTVYTKSHYKIPKYNLQNWFMVRDVMMRLDQEFISLNCSYIFETKFSTLISIERFEWIIISILSYFLDL